MNRLPPLVLMTDTDVEFDALIRLLDDPSETVKQAVQARLSELGPAVLPRLRQAQTTAAEPLRSHLIETAKHLHVAGIEQAWTALMAQPDPDLERGVFLLALYGYPDLDIAYYRARLDEFAAQIRPRVERAEGYERAEILSQFMCERLGFIGNHEEYYDPDNSYINQVINRRTGIPISLSAVYILLARRLDLPVYGVNMPAHFVVKYHDEREEVFLDVFNGGVPFTREAGVRSLFKVGITPQPAYFRAASTKEILLRMVHNLVIIARDAGPQQAYADLRRLLAPWDESEEEE